MHARIDSRHPSRNSDRETTARLKYTVPVRPAAYRQTLRPINQQKMTRTADEGTYKKNPIERQCVARRRDLSDWTATKKAVEEIGPVDLLVNSAGISMLVAFLETEEADLTKLFEVNVKAAVNVSQVVAKGMVDTGKGGAMVNISSISSHMALPLRTSYCSSKGALDQVTRVMALELGQHQSLLDILSAPWRRPISLRILLERPLATGANPNRRNPNFLT
ncbi:L-xylulose reductase [Lamellibrachia satsuma]|nr:L-xylulose reductase [Lamellibrachia satsuma]